MKCGFDAYPSGMFLQAVDNALYFVMQLLVKPIIATPRHDNGGIRKIGVGRVRAQVCIRTSSAPLGKWTKNQHRLVINTLGSVITA